MVLDCLNMKQIFSDWFANMGAWSFALEPYYSEGLTRYFDDPAFERLASVVDPYTYRERLTMPKMVISATGDEFFSPDDSYAWFDGMKGKTYMRLLPNAEHGMIPPQGLSSPSIAHGIRSFYMSVQKDYPLPEITWERYVNENNYSVRFHFEIKSSIVIRSLTIIVQVIRSCERSCEMNPNRSHHSSIGDSAKTCKCVDSRYSEFNTP